MIQTRLFTLLCSRLPAVDNMIEEKRCTPASNAMCRCMDGYYCDKGAECKVCYPCSTYVRHVYNDTHITRVSVGSSSLLFSYRDARDREQIILSRYYFMDIRLASV